MRLKLIVLRYDEMSRLTKKLLAIAAVYTACLVALFGWEAAWGFPSILFWFALYAWWRPLSRLGRDKPGSAEQLPATNTAVSIDTAGDDVHGS